MTELEFEKAARGPLLPVADEFVWGSTEISWPRRRSVPGGDGGRDRSDEANAVFGNNLAYGPGDVDVGHFGAPGRSRVKAGAGYYGALDLSGGLWEQVVGIGHPRGQRCTGVHGSGELDAQGDAQVAGWPAVEGSGGSRAYSITGTGLRGGSFQEGSRFLRVADRTHAEFGHAMRHFSLGWRACRSIPET